MIAILTPNRESGWVAQRGIGFYFGETVKKAKLNPPSAIKATPTIIACNQDDVHLTPFSNTDDIMLTSPSQSKDVHDSYSTPTNTNPAEGKTTAVIAVMRGKPKDGYHRHCSNKHYKQKLVWVLLDSGSDSDLVFVNKDKPMLLPYAKRLVPQLWNTFNGIFQTKCKVWIEMSLFEYSDSKRFYSEPDVVEYNKDSKLQYDLILGTETMKELGIVLDFKAKTITTDEIVLPMGNINHLQVTSTLHASKLNHSLAMELQSTQDTTKCATWIRGAKYKKADLQSVVRDNCKHLSANQQTKLLQLLKKYESLFDGTLGDWKTKPVSFQLKQYQKHIKTPSSKRWRDYVRWGY
jgi:hypothetical protein